MTREKVEFIVDEIILDHAGGRNDVATRRSVKEQVMEYLHGRFEKYTFAVTCDVTNNPKPIQEQHRLIVDVICHNEDDDRMLVHVVGDI